MSRRQITSQYKRKTTTLSLDLTTTAGRHHPRLMQYFAAVTIYLLEIVNYDNLLCKWGNSPIRLGTFKIPLFLLSNVSYETQQIITLCIPKLQKKITHEYMHSQLWGVRVLFRCVEQSRSCDAVPLTITQTFHYNVLIMPKTFLCIKPNSNGLFQVEREAIIATIRLHFSLWLCHSGMICLPDTPLL